MSEARKNWVPLVLAVIVSVVAVIFVNQLIRKKVVREDKIDVIQTSEELAKGTILTEQNTIVKSIPVSARPPRACTAKEKELLLGQQLLRDLPKGGYIQLEDIEAEKDSLDDNIDDGKWAISVSFNGGAISRRLRPGHEIAIIGSFEIMEEVKGDTSDVKKTVLNRRRVTTVILPSVKILSIDSDRRQGGDEFVLALNPEEAQVLIAAQNQGVELTPALRKFGDGSHLNRVETKLVEKATFDKLAVGVKTVEIPAQVIQ